MFDNKAVKPKTCKATNVLFKKQTDGRNTHIPVLQFSLIILIFLFIWTIYPQNLNTKECSFFFFQNTPTQTCFFFFSNPTLTNMTGCSFFLVHNFIFFFSSSTTDYVHTDVVGHWNTQLTQNSVWVTKNKINLIVIKDIKSVKTWQRQSKKKSWQNDLLLCLKWNPSLFSDQEAACTNDAFFNTDDPNTPRRGRLLEYDM